MYYKQKCKVVSLNLAHPVYTPKPTNIAELKTDFKCLASIWNALPQELTDKATLWFRKRLRVCFAAAGGHFEHSV